LGLLFSSVVFGAAMWPDRADACVAIEKPREVFEIDPGLQAVDSESPAPLSEVSAIVYRIANSVCYTHGTCSTMDCGPSGSVILDYNHDPKVSADEELGVRIRVIEGNVPEAMGEMLGSILPLHERIVFTVQFDDVVNIDATVTLTVVDRAGNESPESEPVALTWSGCTASPPGVDQGGCLDEGRFDCSADGSCVELLACNVSSPGRSAGQGTIGVTVWMLFAFFLWFAGRRRRFDCRDRETWGTG